MLLYFSLCSAVVNMTILSAVVIQHNTSGKKKPNSMRLGKLTWQAFYLTSLSFPQVFLCFFFFFLCYLLCTGKHSQLLSHELESRPAGVFNLSIHISLESLKGIPNLSSTAVMCYPLIIKKIVYYSRRHCLPSCWM